MGNWQPRLDTIDLEDYTSAFDHVSLSDGTAGRDILLVVKSTEPELKVVFCAAAKPTSSEVNSRLRDSMLTW